MSTHQLSRRGAQVPSSPIRALAAAARARAAGGTRVLYLNIGQPDVPTPKPMVQAYQNFDDTVLAYAPSDGFPELREKLAGWYTTIGGMRRRVQADDIVVTTGGSEALLFAMAATTDPGDSILVCEPYYTNYSGYAQLLGINTRPVTCTADDNWVVNPTRVEAAIDDTTRALVIPTPGNPTGRVLTAKELEHLVSICDRHGIFMISDEVYRELVYDGPRGTRAPSLLDIDGSDELGVVIDSASKRWSACGARMGWLVTRNGQLREAALRFGQARLSPATVDQYAVAAALDLPAAWYDDMIDEYRRRRDTLVSALHEQGLEVTSPQGAFYLAVPLPIDDAEAFCHWLVTDFELDGETVCLAPLSGFYATPGEGRDEVRMTYVLECEKLERCARILGAGIKAWSARSEGEQAEA
ncbi:MAG: pyridoxal phosphate-dependent aminotransferase [Phycisphaerales bacterium]|nr:pyridoxal phosphate-dependent aminotransferase [Phycisphaerales bacterium]